MYFLPDKFVFCSVYHCYKAQGRAWMVLHVSLTHVLADYVRVANYWIVSWPSKNS